MFQKMKALWDVFKAGESVASEKSWKRGQLGVNAIAALLVTIVQLGKVFGYDFGIDVQMCTDLAIGIVTVANICLTVATTKKLGLPSTKPTVQGVQPTDDIEATKEAVHVQREAPMGNPGISDDSRARAIKTAGK